jgi:hypothetical protein
MAAVVAPATPAAQPGREHLIEAIGRQPAPVPLVRLGALAGDVLSPAQLAIQ